VSTTLTGADRQQGSIIGWFNLSALPSTDGHISTSPGVQVANDFDLQIETDNMLSFTLRVAATRPISVCVHCCRPQYLAFFCRDVHSE